MLNKGQQKWTLPIISVLLLSACGGSAVDRIVDSADKNREVTLSLVNAASESLYLHIKPDVISRTLFDDQHQKLEGQAKQVRGYTYKWTEAWSKTDFGIRDVNTKGKTANLEFDLSRDKHYWLVGTDSNNLNLNMFQRTSSNQSGVYRVRVLATQPLNIYLNGSNTATTTTQNNKVTPFYTVQSCATGLKVGNEFIDFCPEANVGRSYLAVADMNGKLMVVQE